MAGKVSEKEVFQLTFDLVLNILRSTGIDVRLATGSETSSVLSGFGRNKVMKMTAWHGSGMEFDRFDSSHVGQGEGSRIHGWGTYVSVSRETSEDYARYSCANAAYRLEQIIEYQKELISNIDFRMESIRKRAAFDMEGFKTYALKNAATTLNVLTAVYGDDFAKALHFVKEKSWEEQIAGMPENFVEGLYPKYIDSQKALLRDFKNRRQICLNRIHDAEEGKKRNGNILYRVTIPDQGFDTKGRIFRRIHVNDDGKQFLSDVNTALLRRDESILDLNHGTDGLTVKDVLDSLKVKFPDVSDLKYFVNSIGYDSISLPRFRNYFEEGQPVWSCDRDWISSRLHRELEKEEPYNKYPEFLNEKIENIFNEHSGYTYGEVYSNISNLLGGDRSASEFLSRCGYKGIHYNGMQDHECFVIFNDKDIRIDDRIRLMQTDKGVLYGWQTGNSIFLTEHGLNPETPIHEYTHLWAQAMMQKNREGWESVKSLLKGTPLWDSVVRDPDYSGISNNEDLVTSEVLARISGKENAEKLQEKVRSLAGNGGKADDNLVEGIVSRIRSALNIFWSWVGENLFGIKKFNSINEVTDRVLYDMVKGTDLSVELVPGKSVMDTLAMYRRRAVRADRNVRAETSLFGSNGEVLSPSGSVSEPHGLGLRQPSLFDEPNDKPSVYSGKKPKEVVRPGGQRTNLFDHDYSKTNTGAEFQKNLFDMPESVVLKKHKIEDTGEKIGGAKKDLYQQWLEVFRNDMQKTDDQLTDKFIGMSKAKIFNFDFARLRKMGVPNDVVSLVKVFKDSVPVKPREHYRNHSWAEKVQKRYRVCINLLNDWSLLNPMLDKMKEDKSIPSLWIMYDTYMAVGGYDGRKSVGDYILFQNDSSSYEWDRDPLTGEMKRVSLDGKWSVQNNHAFKNFNSRDEAVEFLNEKADVITEKKQFKRQNKNKGNDNDIEIGAYYQSGEIWLSPKGKSNIVLKGGFDSFAEADKYLFEHNVELQETYQRLKSYNFLYRDENRQRQGKDIRNGHDVSQDEFMNTFGFRGVEFGNWMISDQAASQSNLNRAYDALMDLALVLDVQPKALSLNGRLGMAFGSRGSGKFSAHYEYVKEVINLTKTKGAGSLAHEWFHAVDNYFGKMGSHNNEAWATSDTEYEPTMRPDTFHWQKDGSAMYHNQILSDDEVSRVMKDYPRPEVARKWNELMRSINNSSYGQRSRNYASIHGGYWKEPTEMGARAFSYWVKEKLAAMGIVDDYLCNEIEYKESDLSEDFKQIAPQPFDTDYGWMDKAYSGLFNTIQEKEVNDKKVLYQKVGDEINNPLFNPKSKKETELRDNLVTLLRQSGIDVITNFAEGQNAVMAAEDRGDFKAMTAYHGSGADFNRFDNEHYAHSGEGTNSHGWGVYVTTNKDVAHSYVNISSDSYNGYPLYKGRRFHFNTENYTDGEAAARARFNSYFDSVENALQSCDERISYWKKIGDDDTNLKESAVWMVDYFSRARRYYQQYGFKDLGAHFSRHFYTVDIPELKSEKRLQGRNYLHGNRGGLRLLNAVDNRLKGEGKDIITNDELLKDGKSLYLNSDVFSALTRRFEMEEAQKVTGDYTVNKYSALLSGKEKACQFVKDCGFDGDFLGHTSNYIEEGQQVSLDDQKKVYGAILDLYHAYDVANPYGEWSYRGKEADKYINSRYSMNLTGRQFYQDVAMLLGSIADTGTNYDFEEASHFLHGLGYKGIHYDGRVDGDCYVIFDDDDVKIKDHLRYFRSSKGEVYGFTTGGRIYIDPKISLAETPIHEYTHLWAAALREGNPKEWKNVVDYMKDTTFWDDVKKLYPELKTDDDIADEVLATYSGRRGAMLLRDKEFDIQHMKGSEGERLRQMSMVGRLKEALKEFWHSVADMLHIHYESAEQVADTVLRDMLSGINPNKVLEEVRNKENKDVTENIKEDNVLDKERDNVVRDTLVSIMQDSDIEVITDKEKSQKILDKEEYARDIKSQKELGNEGIIVYHGSGHDFNSFSNFHVGEGTGDQCFGYGMYMTSEENIARQYGELGSYGDKYAYIDGVRKDYNSVKETSVPEFLACDLLANYGHDEAIMMFRERIHDYKALNQPYEAQTYSDALALVEGNHINIDKSESHRFLYTAVIPNDHGDNYLDWYKNFSERQADDIINHLVSSKGYIKGRLCVWLDSQMKRELDNGLTPPAISFMPENRQKSALETLRNDGNIAYTFSDDDLKECIEDYTDFYTDEIGHCYRQLSEMMDSDMEASKFLSTLGYTGVRYPADSYAVDSYPGVNYVVFNDDDIKVKDKIRFFRKDNGEVYGFVFRNKVYMDTDISTTETAVHEYSHLWSEALRKGNPQEWQNIVSLMRGTSVWDEIKRNYTELETDDDIADEVLATYSGRRGSERLRMEAAKVLNGNGSEQEKLRTMSMLGRIREALRRFWSGVGDMLHIHYASADEVADRIMSDMLSKVNPHAVLEERYRNEREQLKKDSLANGTYMLTPDGKQSTHTEKQWLQERTPEFKRWYGDWQNTKEGLLDENGEPLVLYHGTDKVFDRFERREGTRWTMGIPVTVKSEGFFFTDNKDYASGFADMKSDQSGDRPRIMPVYVNMRHPADLSKYTNESENLFHEIAGFWPAVTMGYETIDKWWQIVDGEDAEESIAKRLKELGYDGIIFAEEKETVATGDEREPYMDVAKVKSYFVTDANQIKSADENIGLFSTVDDRLRMQFIGVNGAGNIDRANDGNELLASFSSAQYMEELECEPNAIKMSTGWEKGIDGLWRYEIPDIRFKNDIVTTEEPSLGELVDAPDIFKAYPDMKDVWVELGCDFSDDSDAQTFEKDGIIELSSKLYTYDAEGNKHLGEEARRKLAHEIQHLVQYREGFARGANAAIARQIERNRMSVDSDVYHLLIDYNDWQWEKYPESFKDYIEYQKTETWFDNDRQERSWYSNYFTRMLDSLDENQVIALSKVISEHPIDDHVRTLFDTYRSVAGEVEARNVERRIDMSEGERRNILASQSEDILRRDQLLANEDGISLPVGEMAEKAEKAVSFHKAFGEVTKPSEEDVMLRDYLVDRLGKMGIEVSTDVKEGQFILKQNLENGVEVKQAAMVAGLKKASSIIRNWFVQGVRHKSFEIRLPDATCKMIKKVIGRDIDSHFITADGLAHAFNNHGIKGKKIGSESIPLRKEDLELAPYIMTAPDNVGRGSIDIKGRESIRFYKNLSNGYVVVVEKEYENSPDDMETINMWAEKSSGVPNARQVAVPAAHVQNVISVNDAAKIRKDAENAIKNDKKISFHLVYHGSGADFDHFDHSHMGQGEGNQSYGWGTYLSEVEGIAHSYAYSASKPVRTYRGEVIDETDKYNPVRIAADSFSYNNNIRDARKWAERVSGYVGNDDPRMKETWQKVVDLLNHSRKSDFNTLDQEQRFLYDVDIPDDNGHNYIDFAGVVPEEEAVSVYEKLYDYIIKNDTDGMYSGKAKDYLHEELRDLWMMSTTGKVLYGNVSAYLGSDENASKFLHTLGYVGIKYPTQYQSKGAENSTRNYVMFEEKDMNIVNKVKFFKSNDGTAYGFTTNGKIYIDPRIATSETPIHEYAHLWSEALRKGNPEEWKHVVKLMKGTNIWNEVRERYSNLNTDDDIADEVLATYSGRKGIAALKERIANAKGDLANVNGQKAITGLIRVYEAVCSFWKSVADMLHIHYNDADQVADQVMRDMMSGVNPLSLLESKRISEENTAFNKKLTELIDNPVGKSHEIRIGKPGKFLKDGDVLDTDIIVDTDMVLRKSNPTYKNHQSYELKDIENLPYALNNPIAVFNRTDGDDSSKLILTNLKNKENNFLAVLDVEEKKQKGNRFLVVNDIATLYSKNAKGIIDRFNNGLATNIDKEKALRFVSALPNHSGTEIKPEELVSVANIINNFDLSVKKKEILKERDKKYEDAVNSGDLLKAKRMLKEAAFRAGYTHPDYPGKESTAPTSEVSIDDFTNLEAMQEAMDDYGTGQNLYAVINGVSLLDEFTVYHPERSGFSGRSAIETGSVMRSLRDKAADANTKVDVYRVIPNTVHGEKLMSGNWIALSKAYCEELGESKYGTGNYHIIEDSVPIKYVWQDGDDAREFGFDDGLSDVEKNVTNNRKLLEITYDNDGVLIPLSKRFDMYNDDIRYQFIGENGALSADLKESGNRVGVISLDNTGVDSDESVLIRTSNLNKAKKMEADGKDALSIKLATGWEKGIEGKWKYEIPEGRILKPTHAKIKEESDSRRMWYSTTLGKIYSSPLLYKAYPDLKDMPVEFRDIKMETGHDYLGYVPYTNDKIVVNMVFLNDHSLINREGQSFLGRLHRTSEYQEYWRLMTSDTSNYDASKIEALKKEIVLADERVHKVLGQDMADFEKHSPKFWDFDYSFVDIAEGHSLKDTLVHEIQHVIQFKEGFAVGSSEGTEYGKLAPTENSRSYWAKVIILEAKAVSGNDKTSSLQLASTMMFYDCQEYMFSPNKENTEKHTGKFTSEDFATLSYFFDTEEKPDFWDIIHHYADLAEDRAFVFAGEVEARNVRNRMKTMSWDKRQHTLASDTEDTPRGNQTVSISITPGTVSGMFLGQSGARMLDMDNSLSRARKLNEARLMELDGKDPLSIKVATGWEKGIEGKWRYEVSDVMDIDVNGNLLWLKEHPDIHRYRELRDMEKFYNIMHFEMTPSEKDEFGSLSNKYKDIDLSKPLKEDLTIEDFIDSPEVFKAYPWIRNISVYLVDKDKKFVAHTQPLKYGPGKNDITWTVSLNKNSLQELSAHRLKGVFSHEIQHIIQDYEGFARGGNLSLAHDIQLKEQELTKEEHNFVDDVSTYYAVYSKEDMKINPLKDFIASMADIPGHFGNELGQELLSMSGTELIKKYNSLKDKKFYEVDEMSDYLTYREFAGEVESRNVESRWYMSDDERRHTLAKDTEDVPREKQIVVGKETMDSEWSMSEKNNVAMDIDERELLLGAITNSAKEKRFFVNQNGDMKLSEEGKKPFEALMAVLDKDQASSKANVSDVLAASKDIEEKHPHSVILFEKGDNMEMWDDSAKKANAIIGLPLRNRMAGGSVHPYVSFSKEMTTEVLKGLNQAGADVQFGSTSYNVMLEKNHSNVEEMVNKAEKLLESVSKNENIRLRATLRDIGPKYNDETNTLTYFKYSGIKGVDLSTKEAVDHINDVYRLVSGVLLSRNEELSNNGMHISPSELKIRNSLLRDLTASILMLRHGLPSSLSEETMKNADYYRYKLMSEENYLDGIKEKVNSTVGIILGDVKSKTREESKLQKENHEKAIREYLIADKLQTFSDGESGDIVIVKDKSDKSRVDVLVSYRGLGIQEMRVYQSKVAQALKRSGYKDVRFFGGGNSPYNMRNSYFDNKTAEIARLSSVLRNREESNDIRVTKTLDIDKIGKRLSEPVLQPLQITKDDNGKYYFVIKPCNGMGFCVKADSALKSRYYEALNSPQRDSVHKFIAVSLYKEAVESPEKKIPINDVILPKTEGMVLPYVTDVRIKRTLDGKHVIEGLVNGNQMRSYIDSLQYGRMFASDNRAEYKSLLARNVFGRQIAEKRSEAREQGYTDTLNDSVSMEKGDSYKNARTDNPTFGVSVATSAIGCPEAEQRHISFR